MRGLTGGAGRFPPRQGQGRFVGLFGATVAASAASNQTNGKGEMLLTKFEPIDAQTLLSTPLPPVRWLIPDLLPAGLALLAGASKSGKSWLCLWLSLQLALPRRCFISAWRILTPASRTACSA